MCWFEMLQQIRDMETAKNEENEGLRKRITELEESLDEGQKREKDMRSQIEKEMESRAESRIANLQNELAVKTECFSKAFIKILRRLKANWVNRMKSAPLYIKLYSCISLFQVLRSYPRRKLIF